MGEKKEKNYYVMCPFYRKDETVNIRCEGITKESTLVMQFKTKKGREEYQNKYCRTMGYKTCPLRKMLEQKYDK